MLMEPMVADPRAPSLKAQAIVKLFSRSYATGLLRHREYMAGRRFVRPEHRRHVMRPLLRLLTNRIGERVVPEELRDLLPGAERETAAAGPGGRRRRPAGN